VNKALTMAFCVSLALCSGCATVEEAASGEPVPRPPAVRHYTIPTIDISQETDRQVVIDREPGQYLGHPTTVLLEDNRTMIAVYPKGHGRGAVVMKRSADGGLTWSERLPVPDNWATSLEVPTIYRVVDRRGTKRLIMFSGLYPNRMAVSEDDGVTWTPLEPIGDFGGVVSMSSVVLLKDGRYMALFHDDGRFLREKKTPKKFRVYKTLSSDGGLTWSQPEVVTEHPKAHLCEPGVVRSPDGSQLAMLMRENSRQFNSFVAFSNDEGATWSEPVELPGSLTGDRHVGRYSPDGRLVIAFRDTTHVSPTKGDFVAWVGTYDDIVRGREGQYRVRLLDNKKDHDCGYPAVELLPNGTFIATTYGHWIEGEQPFIVSVRFKLAEIDTGAAASPPQQTDVFVAGQNGVHAYRIPALVTTNEGALLAVCDARVERLNDAPNNIDLAMKRSFDSGKSWERGRIIVDFPGQEAATDPSLTVDRRTGTIWLFYDHAVPEPTAPTRRTIMLHARRSDDGGETWSEPIDLTAALKDPAWDYLAVGPGMGVQTRSGRLLVPCYCRRMDGQYRSYFAYSDDHGATWKLSAEGGRDTNECQVVELAGGSLMLNMRSQRNKGCRAVATSLDGGKTWSDITDDPTLVEPRCQASFIRYTDQRDSSKSRLLFSNPASKTHRVNGTVRLSYDEGKTWPVAKSICQDKFAYSCLTVLPDKTIGCLYECGTETPYEKIVFVRFSLDWLTNGGDTIGPLAKPDFTARSERGRGR